MGEVTALGHEAGDDPVELRSFVMQWRAFLANSFVASAQGPEILSCFGYQIAVESEDDAASWLAINLYVEEYFFGNQTQIDRN